MLVRQNGYDPESDIGKIRVRTFILGAETSETYQQFTRVVHEALLPEFAGHQNDLDGVSTLTRIVGGIAPLVSYAAAAGLLFDFLDDGVLNHSVQLASQLL